MLRRGMPRDRGQRAIAARGDQALGPALRGDQAVGELQHLGGGAIVPHKRNQFRVRPAFLERRQERRRRPGERVDRLVLVSHHAQIAAVSQPQLEEPLLQRVRVLVLVHAEPALAGPDGLGGLLVALEEVDRLQQEVIEVDAVLARLLTLVVPVKLNEQVGGDRGLSRPCSLLVLARDDAPRLGPLDLVGEVLRGREAVVARELARDAPDDRRLGVQQLRERLAVVAQRPEEAQLAQGMGVERARRHAPQPEVAQPRNHLARRLVRERHDQCLVRGDHARGDRVGRAPADHPRLAAPGPGEDRYGAGRGEDGLALLGIQVREQVIGGGAGRGRSRDPRDRGGTPPEASRAGSRGACRLAGSRPAGSSAAGSPPVARRPPQALSGRRSPSSCGAGCPTPARRGRGRRGRRRATSSSRTAMPPRRAAGPARPRRRRGPGSDP